MSEEGRWKTTAAGMGEIFDVTNGTESPFTPEDMIDPEEMMMDSDETHVDALNKELDRGGLTHVDVRYVCYGKHDVVGSARWEVTMTPATEFSEPTTTEDENPIRVQLGREAGVNSPVSNVETGGAKARVKA